MRPVGFRAMSNGSAMRCESPGTLSIHTFRGFQRIVPMGTPAASAGRLFAPQWPTFLRLTSNLVEWRNRDPQGLHVHRRGAAARRAGEVHSVRASEFTCLEG